MRLSKMIWILSALALVAVLSACNTKSPTTPDTAEGHLAWCEDHADNCAWFSEVTVKFANSTTLVAGARVLMVSNATQEQHQFATNGSGSSGYVPWTRWIPRSTFWATIERGDSGGLTWAAWERKDVSPVCEMIGDRRVACRVIAEVVPVGIGRAGK